MAKHGPIVQAGPFAGLRLPSAGSWGNFAPLLVGCYEEELHAVIEEVVAAAPKQVINVGSAEGYYAVGMARRLRHAEVWAFDIDKRARQLTRETARMNSVTERVHVAAECSVQVLDRLLMPEALLIVDCEGCELSLLQPESTPSLATATLVVELHDHIDPWVSSTIHDRFTASHSLSILASRRRLLNEYEALDTLDPWDRAIAVDEMRPATMEWAVLRPLPSA